MTSSDNACVIVLSAVILGIFFCYFLMYRNKWIYKNLKDHTEEYLKFPSYDYMLLHRGINDLSRTICHTKEAPENQDELEDYPNKLDSVNTKI